MDGGYKQFDIHGPCGRKESLVYGLIRKGINFNDLKPYSHRRLDLRRSYYSYSNILADAESWMRTWGLSVEDLKSGTFYSFLENGRTMDGKDITKAEGLRMINQINRDNKKEVDELFKDRKEGQSRLHEIHSSYLRLKEQEKKEKEEGLDEINHAKLKLGEKDIQKMREGADTWWGNFRTHQGGPISFEYDYGYHIDLPDLDPKYGVDYNRLKISKNMSLAFNAPGFDDEDLFQPVIKRPRSGY